ncbi:UNVERIFIED_CONTAM: hypothetical protein K2H54_012885 [Gekko kuhli]
MEQNTRRTEKQNKHTSKKNRNAEKPNDCTVKEATAKPLQFVEPNASCYLAYVAVHQQVGKHPVFGLAGTGKIGGKVEACHYVGFQIVQNSIRLELYAGE